MLSIKNCIIIVSICLSACKPAVNFAKDIVVDNAANKKCGYARDEKERYACEKQTNDSIEKYDNETNGKRRN